MVNIDRSLCNSLSAHIFYTPASALQEFTSICEALELIPQDELESYRQKQSDTPANKRAQKVSLWSYPFFLTTMFYKQWDIITLHEKLGV
jgi:hypothetical protein